jgi:hypothetical protein
MWTCACGARARAASTIAGTGTLQSHSHDQGIGVALHNITLEATVRLIGVADVFVTGGMTLNGGTIRLANPTFSDGTLWLSGTQTLGGTGQIIFEEPNSPAENDFEMFRVALDKLRDRKVLVHCQINLRASTMVFLYRVIVEGVPADQAYGRERHDGRAGRKGDLLSTASACQRQRLRIVGVDNRPVFRRLVRENPRLRRSVGFHRAMAVEMVGRQVQQHGDPWMERVRRLQLETAHLDDVKRLRCRRSDLRAERRTDVSSHHRLQSACREHTTRQRGRRRLALGPCDRDDPSAQPARRKLDLAYHPDAGLARRHNGRLIECHPGAQDQQVGRRERLYSMSAQFQLDACVAQLSSRARVEIGPRIGERDARAALGKQQRGGDAATGRSRHRDVLSAHRKAHLSFNVVRLKSAKMMATIRNRVITFGSLQPINSKW